jgi:UDP-N-acetylglucosamine 1-carboxyvinyltransferase
MAALLRSSGTTVFVENMFQNRYRHVAELQRMGANIRLEGRVAVLCGVPRLCGATVRCTDLRGGAALVLAGLQADGITQGEEIHHIKRGYSDRTGDLARLGAEIREIDR